MAWNNNSGGPWGGGVAAAAAIAADRGVAVAAAATRAAEARSARAATRHGRCHPQGPGAPASNLIPGGLGSFKGIVLIVLRGGGDLAGHRLLPRAAQPAGHPARVRQALRQAGRARPALQSARADRQRGGRQRPGPAAHRHRLARAATSAAHLQPRPAPDLDREPDAHRRREHRRHRVRRAVADQGRLQVRLRRAQSRGHGPPAPRRRCARSSAKSNLQYAPDRGPQRASSRTPRTCCSAFSTNTGWACASPRSQLQRVDPPQEVIGAFRDVQAARADKEKQHQRGQYLPQPGAAAGQGRGRIDHPERRGLQGAEDRQRQRRRRSASTRSTTSTPRPRTSPPSGSTSRPWRRCCAT